jgi:hypothetical protein
MHERPEKEVIIVKMRNLLMGSILLAVLFSIGCATGGHDYDDSQYYPGYYPPEYPYLDYSPFHPYYSHPTEERREELREEYHKTH